MKKLICLVAMFSTSSLSAGEQCPLAAAAAHQKATTLVAAPADTTDDIVDTAVAAGQFKTLVAAVEAAGLVDTLKSDGPFTVFAPTDAAFAKLPSGTVEALLKPENRKKLQNILTYHVVSGKVMAADAAKLNSAKTVEGQPLVIKASDSGVMINKSKVVKADIVTSNGVIHVIDSVLMPADKDIVATAAGSKNFSTLVAAVKAAGLVETLQGEGPFTVFAPTDEAFAALPEGTIASLLKPENKGKLVSILTYHVVPGAVLAADAAKLSTAKTVNGEKLSIKTADGKVMIDDATVTAADIMTSNGVVHVIDHVLMP
ncbi:fasciclin domain-containing protein [Allorhodopirellula heiligendammensis]|uniref:Immunogenic protein MPT70 n=1 Tax=Allorhodopirellula heiligendammensis TaxID=2714739 RepID=A0A5C6C064_9BACT|nr:fasciclin domain-containing protein [Allorhodopirellula heiligendammensis]TWU17970.1 Immunogenic protein MPT70 precursor [Allorhodopirellula heiligendammensis]